MGEYRRDELWELGQDPDTQHHTQLLHHDRATSAGDPCFPLVQLNSKSSFKRRIFRSLKMYPPRLNPSGPLNIRHSSICPNEENMTRMSFSVHFLEIIPINSFLSSTAERVKHRKFERYYTRHSSPKTQESGPPGFEPWLWCLDTIFRF